VFRCDIFAAAFKLRDLHRHTEIAAAAIVVETRSSIVLHAALSASRLQLFARQHNQIRRRVLARSRFSDTQAACVTSDRQTTLYNLAPVAAD